MAHREPSAADVVRRDVGGAAADDVEVDGHQWDPRLDQALDLGVLPVDAHQQDAVHSVMARPSDVRVGAAVARSRLLGREQEQVVSVGPDAALEADEHLLEEGVADVGTLHTGEQDDAEELRPLRDERPSGGARRVVQLLGDREDALPGGVAHVVVAVEDAGDGGDRHSAALRDFPDVADLPPPVSAKTFPERKRFRR